LALAKLVFLAHRKKCSQAPTVVGNRHNRHNRQQKQVKPKAVRRYYCKSFQPRFDRHQVFSNDFLPIVQSGEPATFIFYNVDKLIRESSQFYWRSRYFTSDAGAATAPIAVLRSPPYK
jgi:hypothetical protein